MKLNLIGARNLKGQDFVQELTGRDLLVGPNGGGKTSRLDALRLLLLGYVPIRGNRSAGSTHAVLARDPTQPIEVWAEWDGEPTPEVDARVTHTALRCVEPGKQRLTIDGQRCKSLKDGQVVLEALLGAHVAVLDLGKALGGSDAERRSWLLELFPVDVEVPDELRYDGAPTDPAALKADVAGHVTDARGALRQAERTHEVAQQEARSVVDPPDLVALGEELAVARKRAEERAGLAGSLATTTTRYNALVVPEVPEEVPAPTRSSAELNQEGMALAHRAGELTDLIEDAETQVEAARFRAKKQDAWDVKRLQATRAEKLYVDALKGLNWVDDPGTAYVKLEGRLAELADQLRPLDACLAAIGEAAGTCPLSTEIACPVDLTPYATAAQARHDALVEEQARLKEVHRLASSWMDLLEDLGERPPDLEVTDPAPLRQELERVQAKVAELRKDAVEASEREEARLAWLWARDARVEAEAERLNLERETARLRAALDELPELDLETLETRLRAGQEKASKARHVREQVARAAADLQRARNAYERWTARQELVTDLERRALTRSSGLSVPGLGQLEVDAEAARITVGGRSVDALSGGEQVLALASLALKAARGPLKILGVEAGELDAPRLDAMLRFLSDVDLDHALVLRPEGPTRLPQGWTVHRIGGAS